MTAIVSEELLQKLDELYTADDAAQKSHRKKQTTSKREREVPVILSVASKADIALLEAEGFKVTQKFEAISAVAGTLPADKQEILRFAEDAPDVERIEYDGEVRALPVDAPK